jgi:hypothetical protein
VLLVVGVEAGDAGEQILVLLAGEQVAVVERRTTEIGQLIVAPVI